MIDGKGGLRKQATRRNAITTKSQIVFLDHLAATCNVIGSARAANVLPGDANYSNYREANRALWQQAILPLAGKILEALAEGLRPHFGRGGFDGLVMGLDLNAIPALSEDRERLWARVSVADFLDPAEKRPMLGLS